MMKYITAIFMMLSTPIYANELVRVINPYNPTGAAFKLANHLHESNPSLFGSVEKVESCTTAANILKTETNPAVVIWQPTLEPFSASQECKDALTNDNFITFHISSYNYICTKKDSGKDLEYFINGNAKIGYTIDFMYKLALENNVKAVKSNATIIPYQSTNEYMAAFEVDEIDFVYTTKPNDTMSCVLTTDPNNTEIAPLVNYSDDVFSTAGMKIAFLGVNVDLEEMKKVMNESTASDSWKEMFPTYSRELSLLDREAQLDVIQKEVAVYQSQVEQ
jgi:hypothetical protein